MRDAANDLGDMDDDVTGLALHKPVGTGKDDIVTYQNAHVTYAEWEFIGLRAIPAKISPPSSRRCAGFCSNISPAWMATPENQTGGGTRFDMLSGGSIPASGTPPGAISEIQS